MPNELAWHNMAARMRKNLGHDIPSIQYPYLSSAPQDRLALSQKSGAFSKCRLASTISRQNALAKAI
jgi:hypothetical protein